MFRFDSVINSYMNTVCDKIHEVCVIEYIRVEYPMS